MNRFFSTFGRLPSTWTVLLITILAGAAEGFGLTMFVPLLEILNDTGAEPSRFFTVLSKVLAVLGLTPDIMTVTALAVAFVVTSFSLSYLQRRLISDTRHRYARDLKGILFENLLYSSWKHFSGRSQGEIINELTIEISRAAAALQMQLIVIAAAVQGLLLVMLSALISWKISLIALALSTVIVAVTLPLIRKAKRFGEANTKANKEFGFVSADYLKAGRLVKISGAEPKITSRLAPFAERLYQSERNLDFNSALMSFVLQSAPVIMMATIIVIGHKLLEIDTALILVFLLVLARLAPRVAEIPLRYENYAGFYPALRTVDNAIEDAKNNLESTYHGKTVLTSFGAGIRLDNVSLTYSNSDEPAINNVSLSIPARGFTAIVGKSGAGKSSLTDLLIGLRRPTSGQVQIDNEYLENIDLTAWRKRVGYVTQDIIIFNDTLKNNLLITNPDATDKDIESVLDIAHLREIIASLPDGMDTQLGENGIRFSGGQKQRLALARALLGNPWVLVLDEATSALDNETETIIQHAVADLSQNISVVVIAHKLPFVQNAKMIYVLDNGRLVESGSYDTLTRQQGHFAELCAIQHENPAL